MEISKEKLLSIINEVNTMDIDEMAQPVEAKYRPITLSNGEVEVGWSKERIDKVTKKWKAGVILIGWMIHDEPVLFTCGKGIEEFKQEKPEIYESLKQKYPNSRYSNTNLPACQPRREKPLETHPLPDTGGPEEKSLDIKLRYDQIQNATERIKRKLWAMINHYLGNPEMKHNLEALSIPEISTDREYRDNYATVNNDIVEFKTRSYISYKDPQTFLNVALDKNDQDYDRNNFGADDIRTYHMPRLNNKVYQNWDPTRKQEPKWEGYTSIYQLEKYGYAQQDLDVVVGSLFEVKGQRHGNIFSWVITFKTEFGKGLKDIATKKKLHPDKNIVIRKSANIPDGKTFSDTFTVLDDLSISNALTEGLYELVQQLQAMTPKETLRIANIKQHEFKDVNEEINSIIRNVLSEMIK